MNGWQRRLARMSLPAYFFSSAVVFGGLTYALRRAMDPSSPEPWWTSAAGAIVFGLLMTWFTARQRRGSGGADRMLSMSEALQRGRLPEDGDPQFWEAALDRHERTMRRLRRWGPLEFAAFAALDLALAITQHSAWWWVFLAFFAGMLVAAVVSPRRRLRQIERLRGQLRERTSS